MAASHQSSSCSFTPAIAMQGQQLRKQIECIKRMRCCAVCPASCGGSPWWQINKEASSPLLGHARGLRALAAEKGCEAGDQQADNAESRRREKPIAPSAKPISFATVMRVSRDGLENMRDPPSYRILDIGGRYAGAYERCD